LNELTALKKGYTRVFLWLLVTLFLIPTITLLFAEYGTRQLDQEYSALFIDDARGQGQDVNKLTTFLQQNPPSSACGPVPDDLLDYKSAVCAEKSELWQFWMIDKVAFWTLVGGVVMLGMIVLFSMLAFKSRQGQLQSLTLARPFLMLASALEVLVQGECWSGSPSGERHSLPKPIIRSW